MRVLMRSHFWIYSGVCLAGVVLLILIWQTQKNENENYTTAQVTKGEVLEIVSVSGVVEAGQIADLSFPATGVVKDVLVNEGDEVDAGETLLALESNQLYADRRGAVARLQIAKADKLELVGGPREEERALSSTAVRDAETNLERVIIEQNEIVENARRTLLSSNLEAFPTQQNIPSDPPLITGTYTCQAEGQYYLDMYSSNARSGHSYVFSGLESGTQSAYTETAVPLGNCGLFIEFVSEGRFGGTDWYIPVPNKNSSTYVTNQNAYELALEQRTTRIAKAEEALTKATQKNTLNIAVPRSEALTRANAQVLSAEAQIERVDSLLADRQIIAPFKGMVTDLRIEPGETAGSSPVVQILSDDNFTITARVPEIDIAKIQAGQLATVVFDANASEVLEATIEYISPVATEIDGVAYFKATLAFTNPPSWLRTGLNADIDIIISKEKDTLRAPLRYVTKEDERYFVYLPKENEIEKKEVRVGLVGDNGFIELLTFSAGQTLVLPQ